LIYLLNQEPRLEPFSRTKPGNHPLLTLIESQENNITDISLLVPKVSVNNAITLEKGIFNISNIIDVHPYSSSATNQDGLAIDNYIRSFFSDGTSMGQKSKSKDFITGEKIIFCDKNELDWHSAIKALGLKEVKALYNCEVETLQGEFVIKKSEKSSHITDENLEEDSPSQSRQDKIDAAAYREMHNPLSQLKGKSTEMKLIKDKIKKWANNDRPILLLGDVGVGKKYTARIIHEYSNRKDKPFQKANISTTEQGEIAAKLFGTADDIGWIQAGEKGTVFLDEIGDTDYKIQKMLLKVIQDKKIQSIGTSDNNDVDVRLIISTNKNLQDMINDEQFDESLYDEIKHNIIEIPPLSERTVDIPILIEHFLKQRPYTWSFTDACLGSIKNEIFDGNVRDLKNIIEVINDEEHEDFAKLSWEDVAPIFDNRHLKIHRKHHFNIPHGMLLNEFLDALEMYHIPKTLKEVYKKTGTTYGVTKKTAELLGISRSSIKYCITDKLNYKNVGSFLNGSRPSK